MSHDDLDRRLDEQLRAAFAPLPPERFKELAAGALAPPRTPWSAWPVWLLTMAALCLLTWSLARPARRPEGGEGAEGAALGAMWVAAFEDATQRGFANCCDASCGGCGMGSFDLGQACRQRFDAHLRVTAEAALQVMGAYQGLPTGRCMTLLAQSDEAPVCLFVMPRTEDRGVELPRDKALHLARREVGDLVLYALARSPGSAALSGFAAH